MIKPRFRIIFDPLGTLGDPVVLLGSATVLIAEPTVQHDRAVTITPLLRGDHPSIKGGHNRYVTLSWSERREHMTSHTTGAQALSLAATHFLSAGQSLPVGQADVLIQYLDCSGLVIGTNTLKDAVCSGSDGGFLGGSATLYNFQIIGKRITNTNPMPDDFFVAYTPQSPTPEQAAQARENLGIPAAVAELVPASERVQVGNPSVSLGSPVSDYPVGRSVTTVSAANGWPSDGFLITDIAAGKGFSLQRFIDTTADLTRQWWGGGWNDFAPSLLESAEKVRAVTADDSSPPTTFARGYSYFQTTNYAYAVERVNGTTTTRQTRFHRTSGGVETRIATSTTTWGDWKKLANTSDGNTWLAQEIFTLSPIIPKGTEPNHAARMDQIADYQYKTLITAQHENPIQQTLRVRLGQFSLGDSYSRLFLLRSRGRNNGTANANLEGDIYFYLSKPYGQNHSVIVVDSRGRQSVSRFYARWVTNNYATASELRIGVLTGGGFGEHAVGVMSLIDLGDPQNQYNLVTSSPAQWQMAVDFIDEDWAPARDGSATSNITINPILNTIS